MTAAHGQGPPRSTLADLMASIVGHYGVLAPDWTSGTTYARGDIVNSAGIPYVCHAPGIAAGAGPSGVGSQRDGGGVLWAPMIYVGDRYIKQHGAPPRIVLIRGDGQSGGPGRTGDGLHVARNDQKMIAAVWADEALADLARYAALDDMLDRFENIVRKVAPGRATLANLNPTIHTNIVTWGEDMQVHVTYSRGVPRDAAAWDVPVDAVSPYDPMRPNGDTGLSFGLSVSTQGSR